MFLLFNYLCIVFDIDSFLIKLNWLVDWLISAEGDFIIIASDLSQTLSIIYVSSLWIQ